MNIRYRIVAIERPLTTQLSSSRAPVLEALCIRQLALAEDWLVVSIDVLSPTDRSKSRSTTVNLAWPQYAQWKYFEWAMA